MSEAAWWFDAPAQADIGGFVLDISIEPSTEGDFFIELKMPPKKEARRVVPVVMATGRIPTRAAASGWIEGVAPVVLTKLQSAERAMMLRKGYV